MDDNNDGYVDGTTILESRLKIFRINGKTGEWERIENSRVDTVNNIVYAKIKKFGVFTAMGDYEPTSFEESFYSYPNPADLRSESFSVKLRRLEPSCPLVIKISDALFDLPLLLLVVCFSQFCFFPFNVSVELREPCQVINKLTALGLHSLIETVKFLVPHY